MSRSIYCSAHDGPRCLGGIWGTLCAILARLTFSPTYKTGICIYILLWPLSEIASRLLPPRFQVIVWWRNRTKSLRADTNWQLLFWEIWQLLFWEISLFFFFPLAFRVPEVRVNVVIIPKSTCVYLFVCAKREKEKPLKHFKKHQAQSVLICSGTLRNWAHCLARWQSGKPLTSVVLCRYSLFVHLPAF